MKKVIIFLGITFFVLFSVGAYTSIILIDKLKPTLAKSLEYLKTVDFNKILEEASYKITSSECKMSVERNLTFERLLNISLGDTYRDLRFSCIPSSINDINQQRRIL